MIEEKLNVHNSSLFKVTSKIIKKKLLTLHYKLTFHFLIKISIQFHILIIFYCFIHKKLNNQEINDQKIKLVSIIIKVEEDTFKNAGWGEEVVFVCLSATSVNRPTVYNPNHDL